MQPLLDRLGALRDLDVASTQTLPTLRSAYVAGDAARAAAWGALWSNRSQAAAAPQRKAVRLALQEPLTGQALLGMANGSRRWRPHRQRKTYPRAAGPRAVAQLFANGGAQPARAPWMPPASTRSVWPSACAATTRRCACCCPSGLGVGMDSARQQQTEAGELRDTLVSALAAGLGRQTRWWLLCGRGRGLASGAQDDGVINRGAPTGVGAMICCLPIVRPHVVLRHPAAFPKMYLDLIRWMPGRVAAAAVAHAQCAVAGGGAFLAGTSGGVHAGHHPDAQCRVLRERRGRPGF